MTPAQEQALLDATARGLDGDLKAAYERLLELMRSGTAPRDAVTAVMETFSGQYQELLSTAFGAILAQSVGNAAVEQMQVGALTLSGRLYAQTQQTAAIVQGIVDRHAKGFQDVRRLTLEIYEGYDFREVEPLKMNPRNPALPKYMREELLTDPGLAGQLQRHFTKLQAQQLRTPALRAAYMEYLDALEKGKGEKVLARKLETAFYEKMRYFANRIAQTELHRAYSLREAQIIDDDPDVEYVQIRMSPTHPETDICDYYAGVDRYGLGKGVYPKKLAPVPPFHPHCLTGDALISSSGVIAGVSKRWFDGDIVIITTASGKRLSATVNHPVLTRRGWVGAGVLDVGDDVVARVDVVAVGADALGNDQHQNMPSSIAEIADSFLSSGEVLAREMPVTAEDFHGDGEGSKVAVIGADRKLWDRVDAAASQVAGDHFLDFAHAALAGLFGKRVLDLGLEGAARSPDRIVSLGDNGASLLGGHLRHADKHRLSAATALNAEFIQPAINHAPTDAELARQIQSGATGPVFFDQIVNIERNAVNCHVYNLETDQGHYTANGIITHNCRCLIRPRLDFSLGTKTKEVKDADQKFIRAMGDEGARIMGSKEKLQAVLSGASPNDVHNATIDPAYRVKVVQEVVRAKG